MDTASSRPFLARHEFLIRRLHSLTGLVPVGAYMVVHLMVNLTVWDVLGGPAMFQRAVYQIHSLGGFLPFVEWAFIFGPMLFHGIFGLVILRGALPNSGAYPHSGNVRYTLQRVSGVIAFAYILLHVFHLHGWFHIEFWREGLVEPLGGAQFAPFNAASTLGIAMQGVLVLLFYVVGVLACVFHLANGIWTMGITWGVWTSPAAQRRASALCAVVGVGLALVSGGALVGAVTVDVEDAAKVEDKMYNTKVTAGEIKASEGEHKRASDEPHGSAAVTSAGKVVRASSGQDASRPVPAN